MEDVIHKKSCSTKLGVFFHDGESWREQRRFALRYMRDFGFGRRFDSLEAEIEIQIRQFIDIIKHGPKFEHEKVDKSNTIVGGKANDIIDFCYRNMLNVEEY